MKQPTTDDVRGLCFAMNEVRDFNDKDGINNMWGALKRFLEQFPQFQSGDIATATIPDIKPPQLSQAELYEGLRKLVDRIELCGASPELTNAVVLAADIKEAVGNQWNKASEFAADRVRENIADGRTFTDSLRCKECPELPGQIHRGGGVYSLCPPCNGTGYINPVADDGPAIKRGGPPDYRDAGW